MSVTAKPLINAQSLGTGSSTLYVAPASTRTIIDKMTVTNTDVSARTVSVWLVPSGGAVGISNQIVSSISLAANQSMELTDLKNHVLASGDIISAGASVGSVVTIRASGREVV